MTTTTDHFTAWLSTSADVTDGVCDVAVLADTVVNYKGENEPVWESTGDPLFTAPTTVDTEDGDHADAQRQAERLLADAGWTLAGRWEAVDTGYVVTVERV